MANTHTISGDVSIATIQEVYDTLQKQVAEHGHIDIVVENITGFSISFIQLLLAIEKSDKIQLVKCDIDQELLQTIGIQNLANI